MSIADETLKSPLFYIDLKKDFGKKVGGGTLPPASRPITPLLSPQRGWARRDDQLMDGAPNCAPLIRILFSLADQYTQFGVAIRAIIHGSTLTAPPTLYTGP